MKYTLLEMVQSILRSIKGESVTNYNDTEESSMVADIVKECYYDLLSTTDLNELKTVFELTASSSSTPIKMSIPTGVVGVDWVKYNKNTDLVGEGGILPIVYDYVEYLPFEDFMNMTQALNRLDDNVEEIDLDLSTTNKAFLFRNDKHPDYYTSYNDSDIIFDSYNSDVETYLSADKTMAFGLKEDTWTASNSFTPNLDAQQFNILIKEAKAMAWQELKSIENNQALKSARGTRIWTAMKKNKPNYQNRGYYYEKFADYGRRR